MTGHRIDMLPLKVFVPSLEEVDSQGLQYWLFRFILEVRTKKGTEYAPNTLHIASPDLWNHETHPTKP